jgi:hypothetical protein
MTIPPANRHLAWVCMALLPLAGGAPAQEPAPAAAVILRGVFIVLKSWSSEALLADGRAFILAGHGRFAVA